MIKLDIKTVKELDTEIQAAEVAVMEKWAKKLNTTSEELIQAYMEFQLKRMQADREMEMATQGKTITPDLSEKPKPKKDKEEHYKS